MLQFGAGGGMELVLVAALVLELKVVLEVMMMCGVVFFVVLYLMWIDLS